MKRLGFLLMIMTVCASTAFAFDLKDALKKAGKGDSSALGALAGTVDGLLSSDKIDVADLAGSWKYSAPAVTFKSENILKKAGGAAAAGVIEEKLAPIYKTAGLESMTISINTDSTFTMKSRGISVSGSIEPITEKDSDANFVFNFKASKLKLGKMNTYVRKSASGTLSIMFDVSKLVTILESVGKVSNNSTLNSVVEMLKSFDGVCAGFALTK